MVRPRPATFDKVKVVAENRRARFDYAIDTTYEAGIALTGTEVKSLRFGEGSIAESYAEVKDEQVWLINANIPEFSHGILHPQRDAQAPWRFARPPAPRAGAALR